MTVSQPNTVPETEETVIDAMIRAGASTGLGYEDLYVQFRAAGFKVERDHIRSIVIPGSTTPALKGLQSGR
jgi:hypothetical protein